MRTHLSLWLVFSQYHSSHSSSLCRHNKLEIRRLCRACDFQMCSCHRIPLLPVWRGKNKHLEHVFSRQSFIQFRMSRFSLKTFEFLSGHSFIHSSALSTYSITQCGLCWEEEKEYSGSQNLRHLNPDLVCLSPMSDSTGSHIEIQLITEGIPVNFEWFLMAVWDFRRRRLD